MTIVTDMLQQRPGVRQPQRKFLAVLFATILALRGRVTGRNLSRYCDSCERTRARQFRAAFDWPDFHQRVLTAALDPYSDLISAQDASFIPKSGKQTFGLGHFFNGCAKRAERGLGIATLAIVDVARRCVLTLAVAGARGRRRLPGPVHGVRPSLPPPQRWPHVAPSCPAAAPLSATTCHPHGRAAINTQ
jgi:hypothetical protein